MEKRREEERRGEKRRRGEEEQCSEIGGGVPIYFLSPVPPAGLTLRQGSIATFGVVVAVDLFIAAS